jgi:HEAT repeat protein
MTPAELAAIAARGRADAGELARLVEALGAPAKAVQRGAAETLAELARAGQPIDEVLARALESDVPRRRWGAAYAWARRGAVPRACLPVLLDALGSADGDLRWASAAILRDLADCPELVPALRALLTTPDALRRKMALYCLRDLRASGDGLDGELLAALEDREVGVRLAALSAVACLAVDRAAAGAALVRRLDDGDPGVRRAAAAALGRLGVSDPAVTAALRRALVADDPALARAAAGALAAVGGARR